MSRVVSLHRYPVKSLVGEELDRLAVDERGVVGDRLWSVRDPDGRFGSGKTTRRFRRMDGLLQLRAAYDGEVPVVTFPDGSTLRGDDPAVHEALSAHVGRPVRLAHEERASHFDEGPLHLVGTGALRRLGEAHGAPVDVRRSRANVLVDTDATEDAWTGRQLQMGTAVLQVLYPMPRCVMLDLPQDGLERDRVHRTVLRVADGALGVVADVVTPGEVRLGDQVTVC